VIHFVQSWGLWWPDYDRWPERTYAYVQKHLGDMAMTVQACQQRRVVVQAGGHVGLWPLSLAGYFEHVVSCEPDAPLFECMKRNAEERREMRTAKMHLIPCALGNREGQALLQRTEKAGSATLASREGDTVPIHKIDTLLAERGIEHCDAIILDIEGCEVPALQGAAETIRRHRPAIHVEQLKQHRARSDEYLRSIGYAIAARAGHDALYLPEAHEDDQRRLPGPERRAA
jgi:FkbM family methyltransferase